MSIVHTGIGSQIIEPRLAFYYHQFPVALSHANLVGFVKFPVQVIVMFLLCILAQKGRSDRDSVETITSQLSVGITLVAALVVLGEILVHHHTTPVEAGNGIS